MKKKRLAQGRTRIVIRQGGEFAFCGNGLLCRAVRPAVMLSEMARMHLFHSLKKP
jgi:hypothetical protein